MFEFVGLEDQQPFTPWQISRIASARQAVLGYLEERENYVRSNALDPAVWMPGANWNLSQPFYARVSEVLGNPDKLRLIGSHFTGYSLVDFGGNARDVRDIADYMKTTRDETSIVLYNRWVNDLPIDVMVRPPQQFGEIGWLINQAIVNHDTAAYAERISLLNEGGVIAKLRTKAAPRAIEIGGGYGALAHYLKEAIPNLHYTIVDLPETLAFSQLYLSALHSDGLEFVPNYKFPEFVSASRPFDLAVNTLSMSEMTEHQVRVYCAGIHALLDHDGVFFEQNQDNRHLGYLNAQDIIADYFQKTRVFGGSQAHGTALPQGFAHLWAIGD